MFFLVQALLGHQLRLELHNVLSLLMTLIPLLDYLLMILVCISLSAADQLNSDLVEFHHWADKWLVAFGPRCEKTYLRGFANKTGADQPAHLRSLISACVIRLMKSIKSRLASSEISTFWLVSVVEETGLSLALSETR